MNLPAYPDFTVRDRNLYYYTRHAQRAVSCPNLKGARFMARISRRFWREYVAEAKRIHEYTRTGRTPPQEFVRDQETWERDQRRDQTMTTARYVMLGL